MTSAVTMMNTQQTTTSNLPKTRVLDSKYHEKVLQELVKRNRRCADCLKPSPSFVNLSIGTFVCLECSGLLREFGFRTKGVGLSTFTPQEVQMLDVNGGNKRANEVYLGKHPDGEKATPGWENVEILKRFLSKKYQDKQWYDESVASRPAEPVRSRADSAASSSPGGLGLESPSKSGGRKRVGSRDGITRGATAVASGESNHRSFLAATHARAAAQHQNSSSMASSEHVEEEVNDEDTEDEDSSGNEGLNPAERDQRRKDEVRRKIRDFYTIHNPEKMDSLELFVEWVMYHGMSAFNKKLREKYGTDIPHERKKDLQTKRDKRKAKERQVKPPRKEIVDQAYQLQALEEAAQALALQDLASRKRAGSTNPFDDFGDSSYTPSTTQASRGESNPFDDLMFL